jgi:hypothetical protein
MSRGLRRKLSKLTKPSQPRRKKRGTPNMGYGVKDEQLKNTRALPSAASTTVNGAAIDLGHSSKGDVVAPFDVKISAPAVNTTMAPDTRTFTYSLIQSDNADLSAPDVINSACIVQTGAGGAGAAAATFTTRVPVDAKRYLGVRITSGASTADASTVSATLELLL